ncbi:MAG: hypothetical protein U5O39_11005 [Gammaproteobacteria bacterium]|nr:hypothetical protein [Gammaproteobacteria bacterium]
MNEYLLQWLESFGMTKDEGTYFLVVTALLAITALVVHVVLHYIVLRVLGNTARASEQSWRKALFGHNLFTRLALVLQAIIFYAQARFWLEDDSLVLEVIEMVAYLWVILFSLLALFSCSMSSKKSIWV